MLAVVFDMDGVIFDTEAMCRRAWRSCSGKYGIPDVDGLLEQCIGANRQRMLEVFEAALGKEFPTLEFQKDARNAMKKLIAKEGIPVKKGVREILTFLKEQNASVGLASSTNYDTVVRELDEAGLLSFFEVIIGGDQIERSKPDPEIYRKACEALKVKPENAYAVEDSYNGIRSAWSAGMQPIMVPDLLPPTEEMKGMAYRILPDLIEVKRFLQENTLQEENA